MSLEIKSVKYTKWEDWTEEDKGVYAGMMKDVYVDFRGYFGDARGEMLYKRFAEPLAQVMSSWSFSEQSTNKI